VKYLYKESPALASSLEQGNVLNDVDKSKTGELVVELGFAESSAVFCDYLLEGETFERLRSFIVNFFHVSREDLSLDIKLIKKQEQEHLGFNSVAEIQEKENEIVNEQRRGDLQKNELIKEAQNLFGSKIDKLILN